MLCPKCKNQLDDNSQYCPICKAKVRIPCPACGTLNIIGAKICINCSLELIKFCPSCNAANLPTATICRKCKAEFPLKSAVSKLAKAVKQDLNEQVKSEPIVRKINIKSHLSKPTEINAVDGIQVQPTFTQTMEEVQAATETNAAEQKIIDDNTTEITLDATVPTPDFTDEISQNGDEKTDELNQNESQKEEITGNFDGNEDIDAIEENEENAEVEDINEFDDDEIQNDDEEITENREDNIENEDSVAQSSIVEDEVVTSNESDYIKIQKKSQMEAKNIITDALNSADKYIVGFSAEEGQGKTTVLRHVFEEIHSHDLTWLFGECNPLTQITPMGAIQDTLITYFNLSSLCIDINSFKKDTKQFFETEFAELTNEEVSLLINLIYPHRSAHYEHINENHEITFNMLEKLFRLIKQKNSVVFVIDDFDMIDGASYDFIMRLIDTGVVGDGFKLIITYSDERPVQGYLGANTLSSDMYETVFLKPLNNEEIGDLIKLFLNGENPLPPKVANQVITNANGSAAYVDQAISFLSEVNALKVDNDKIIFVPEYSNLVVPASFGLIFRTKLGLFKTNSPDIHKIIVLAALLGNKFNTNLLEFASEIESSVFETAVKTLIYFGYFIQMSDTTISFKNTLMWREAYNYAKTDDNFEEYNKKLYEVIQSFNLTNNSLKALVAQNLEMAEAQFQYWTENMKASAFVGDKALYVISQKQCLKLLDEFEHEKSDYIKNNIYERVGKILTKSAPTQAIEFLSNALINAQNNNDVVKIIDMATYIGISANSSGNYLGIIEIVDEVLKAINSENLPIETVLIKQKKLNAICMLGNYEEIINLAENEVLPMLKEIVTKPNEKYNVSLSLIYEGWFEANLTLAKAYSLQGNYKGLTLLQDILEIVKINQLDNKYYVNKLQLAYALANTVSGDIHKSENILREVMQNYGEETIEADLLSQWNFIQIMNKFYLKDYEAVQKDLFSVVTFANNCNDYFTKNILKTILGKLIKENGHISKAIDIYNEQIAYFAQEKIALGAMLAWYFISEATLQIEGAEKALEIVEKALNVAKNPKINSYYFMILYKSLIAEIYLLKGDFDATKMYLEKAILIAQKYNLNYLLVKLYLQYGKYLEEIVRKNQAKETELAANIEKYYANSENIADQLSLDTLADEAQAARKNFRAYQQLNP